MLNKVKVIAVVESIVLIVRMFVPDLELPEGFAGAVQNLVELIVALGTVYLAWKVRETPATVAKLALKKGRLP